MLSFFKLKGSEQKKEGDSYTYQNETLIGMVEQSQSRRDERVKPGDCTRVVVDGTLF